MLKISVIIPAYNASRTIGSCVDAVLRQEAPGVDIEVIVVDDGSTDTTAQIVGTFERVQCLCQANAGPASARNHGAGHASGDILVFTDADCVPRPDWIRQLTAVFETDGVDAAAGSYGISNPGSLLARCVHREIRYRHVHRMGEWTDVFGSYNAAVRREVFEKISGFDESYRFPSGEDNDLSYRLRRAGVRIRFVKDARVDHVHPVSVRRYLYEQFRHGLWRVKMYRSFPGMMAGDGYTFWKDSLEVVFVLMTAGAIAGGLIFPLAWQGLVPGMIFWVGLEVFFAWKFRLRTMGDVLFFAWVMFLRSWARTAGFFSGFLIRL